MLRKTLLFLTALLMVQFLAAQAPQGYYSATKGKTGSSLKSTMSSIINAGYHSVGYDGLYKAYESTDCRADGKVWDMYSDMTSFDFKKDRAGNYKNEGDCYNREHSFPQSWFNGGRMKSDLFNVYPTDGKINGIRSNYPYGETDGTGKSGFKSHNGWSKRGSSKTPGYSGVVFEPNDEYKGDFARSYFYIATCYESQIAGWNSPMLSHDKYTAFAPWAMDMLMRWAKEDPVSEKEINRNNAVYKFQKNRNPFIDFPGLENYVWGDKSSTAFDPDNYVYEGGGEVTPDPDPNPQPQPDDKKVAAPTFSIPSSLVLAGTEVTITSATEGATIYYTVNSGDLQSKFGSATLTINQTSKIEAYAMLGEAKSQVVTATYTVAEVPTGKGDIYEKVYNTKDLVVGSKYLIVCEDNSLALAGITGYNKDVRDTASVTIDAKTIRTEVSKAGYPYALVLGKDAQGYTFYDKVTNTYLAVDRDKNVLPSVANADVLGAHWNIEIAGGNTSISNAQYTNRSIRYNPDSPRFSTYVNKERVVVLYKEKTEVAPDHEQVAAPVFSVASGAVRKGTPVTISCATPDAVICYTLNGGAEKTGTSPVSFTVEEALSVEAYAKVGEKVSEKVTVDYTLVDAPVVEQGSFVKVTSPSELTAGSRYLIVCEGQSVALSEAAGKYGSYRSAVNVEIISNVISSKVSSTDMPYALTLGGDETTGYTFYDAASGAYLALLSGSENDLNNVQEVKEEALWKISFEGGDATIRNMKFDNRTIRYNNAQPRFSTYKGGQNPVALYKEYLGEEDVKKVAAPVFSLPSGRVKVGTVVTVTTATEGATIVYAVNGGEYQTAVSPLSLTVTEKMDIEAYAALNEVTSDTVKVSYTLSSDMPEGTAVYAELNDIKALYSGLHCMIVSKEYEVALAEPTGKDLDVRGIADVNFDNHGELLVSETSVPGYPYVLTLGGSAEGYTLYDKASKGYLAFTGKSNRLPMLSEATANDVLWTITKTSDNVEIRSVKDNSRVIMYNNNQPRFVAYTAASGQHPVTLFIECEMTGIQLPVMNAGKVDVYTLDGRLLRQNVEKSKAVQGLPRGIYVVGGRKMMIR